jgi:hypothetical protein
MFYRAALEGCSNEGPRSHRDIRNALKAQNLCRMTLKVLLALQAAVARRAARHAVAAEQGTREKSKIERTNYWRGKIPRTTSHLPIAPFRPRPPLATASHPLFPARYALLAIRQSRIIAPTQPFRT